MTKEDKDLLLKDLSARLLYDVKVNCNDKVYNFTGIHSFNICILSNDEEDNAFTTAGIKYIKPYLFPLSSMTEEQCDELYAISELQLAFTPDMRIKVYKNTIEWFLKNHIDYNGLIEKGLAIDASGLNIH